MQQFAQHNFAAAETTLEAGNLEKPGTAEWAFEAGSGLVRAALAFKARGDDATAQPIVRLALVRFAQAEALFSSATPAGEQANELDQVGYLYQRFMGDYATAEKYYRRAVTLSPNTGQAALHLRRIEAILAALAKSNGQ
ncbi:MAG: hypothetical protein ACREFX_15465 [Opitutaceae bacterium]